MSILITGGAGYIGSHMVWALADAGQPVVVVDNLTTGFDWALPPDVPLIRGNCGDAALLDRLLPEYGVSAVIHFAGSAVVPESMADPLGYYLNNTVNAQALLAACVRHGVRDFVFSSTAAVYGDPAVMPVTEETPLNPLSPYGWSKRMVEQMLADTHRAHGLRYVALRYFNVAGADPQGRTGQSTLAATHLIKVACQAALGLRPGLMIFGTDYPTPDGTGVRDYIHVSDLVAAHQLALEHLAKGGDSGPLNCGYGRGFSVREVIETVQQVSGRVVPVTEAPRRAGDIVTMVAAADRIRALGWQPRHAALSTIVAHALEWEARLQQRNRR